VQAARIAKERDRANQEAETSHRVSSFLQELLQVSNPEATRSKEITTKEMLDNAAQQLDIELKDEPKIRARVMSTLVDVYRGLEMHDAAESLGQRTLTLVESIFGANSLEYAGALDDIGGHENDVRAQEIRSKLLAPDDIRLAQGLYDLGMDAIGRDLPGGEATLLRGLVLTEHARLPAEKKTRLWILTALGVARAKAQDYRAAADYLRQALVIREEIFHPNHRDRIWGLFDLGTVLTLAGELAEARPYLESAFTISKRAFGPNNRTVGGAASSLGDLERREGHLDRARMLLEEAVGILESTNPDDGWMGDTLFSLALVDEGQGRLGEAVDRMGRSRKIWAKAPGVLDPCPEYARLLRKAGRITEAEKVEAEMKSAEPKP
jgi:tetratricopeptide (TPR) repeat protein